MNRTMRIGLAFLLLLATTARAEEKQRVLDAKDIETLRGMKGQEVTVRGTVCGYIHTGKKELIVHFAETPELTGYLAPEHEKAIGARLGAPLGDTLAGKKVLLTGRIESHKTILNLVVEKADQIEIVGAVPRVIDVTDIDALRKSVDQVMTVRGVVNDEIIGASKGLHIRFERVGTKVKVYILPEHIRAIADAFDGSVARALRGKEILVTGKLRLGRDNETVYVDIAKPDQIQLADKVVTKAPAEQPAPQPQAARTKPAENTPLGNEPARSAGSAAAASRGSFAAAQAKERFAAGGYQETLDLIAKVVSYKGKDMEGVNPTEMYTLQAECELRLGKRAAAIKTLEFLGKQAEKDGLFENAAKVYSTILLIQRSPENVFVPKVSGGAASISILDPEQRRRAYDYLFEEWRAKSRKLLEDAQANQGLGDVLQLAGELPTLRALEQNATAGQKQTDVLAKEAVKFSSKRVASWLDETDADIKRIREKAMKKERDVHWVPNGRGVVQKEYLRLHGVEAPDAKKLHGFSQECKAIPGAIARLVAVSRLPEPFEGLATHAKDTEMAAFLLVRQEFGEGTVPGIRKIGD